MMNVQLILIHAALCFFLFPPGTTEQPAADTLQINSTGKNNSIVVDSVHWHSQASDTTTMQAVTGTISQAGENNSVEINTGREVGENRKSRHLVGAPKNKKQITNKCQNLNNKNQTKPETRNIQHVTIKQTGKNNSVKINQR